MQVNMHSSAIIKLGSYINRPVPVIKYNSYYYSSRNQFSVNAICTHKQGSACTSDFFIGLEYLPVH